ncbi:proteasome activator complex subunit 2 isoform X2 [Bufo gargarizans]|uniref:proteasome activator complex subunit 2 isoform X2 n=1 Tax=Bufo gargarizans TaxID=30331 RepID=UPI001CF118F5|nr:proteasome activator complex subunit 2 isoform X2 [Bufo gargarizans]
MSKACTLKISLANKEKVDGFCTNLNNQSDVFNINDLTSLHSELNIPIPDPPNPEAEETKMETDKEEKKAPKCGFLKENEKLQKILNIVLPEIRILRERCALIITWINHLIPTIEDGNDFGVSVQEKVLERVTALKTKVETLQTSISKYLTERGDAVAKASKETHVMDYRALVHDKDEGAFVDLKLALIDVRNIYIEIFDIILKNFEKITNPKGEDTNTMY